MPILVVVSLIVLINLYLVLLSKNSMIGYPIGKRQDDLFNTYQKAESALFYIDQSAKYSLQKAVHELAKDGGFSNEISDEGMSIGTNECGKFGDANIWYELKRDKEGKIINDSCFDEASLSYNLENKFDEILNEYLASYPYDIPIDNYDYEVKGSLEITGTARGPLMFDILKDEGIPFIRKPKAIKVQIEPKKPEEKKPAEEKPKEPKEPKTPPESKDFEDFTGTNLCAKGTKCLLAKEAYALLLKAQEIAKQKKLDLEVTSAYRSMQRQIEIWEGHADKYPDPKVRRKYIANPYQCSGVCPHGTGNVVDIKLKGKTFSTMSSVDWLALHEIMSQAGWVRYKVETWHFECCGTDRYNRAQEIAKKTGTPVTAIT